MFPYLQYTIHQATWKALVPPHPSRNHPLTAITSPQIHMFPRTMLKDHLTSFL